MMADVGILDDQLRELRAQVRALEDRVEALEKRRAQPCQCCVVYGGRRTK